MGGPGSGRRPERAIARKDLDYLYGGGLEERLLAGDADASTEFIVRLDKLRLQNRLSGKQHQDLTKSAAVRRALAPETDTIRRMRKALREAKEKLALAGMPTTFGLRDIGAPPDDHEPAGPPPDDEGPAKTH